MKTIFSLAGIVALMQHKPKQADIYAFFKGANVLTKAQIEEVEAIVTKEAADVLAFLKQQKQKLK